MSYVPSPPLTDVPMYGHLPAPRPRPDVPRRTTDPCPECGRGRVVYVGSGSDRVRYVCSRKCGWDA